MQTKSKLRLMIAATFLLATHSSAIASDPDMTLMSFKAPSNSFIARLFVETPNSAVKFMTQFADRFMQSPSFYEGKTNLRSNGDIKLIQIKDTIQSPIRSALQSMPAEFLSAFEAFLQKDAEEQTLFHLACNGSFSALRQIAYSAKDPIDCMKFLYIELLMSFGRSYDFAKMTETTEKLSLAAEKKALKDAAIWLSNSYYTRNAEGSLDNEGVNLPSLLRDNNPSPSESAQYSFLQFFNCMGIEKTSRENAMKNLNEAAKKLVSAKELLSLLVYLREFSTDSKNALFKLSRNSSDPNFSNIHLLLINKNPKEVPQYQDQKSVIADLEKHLGLNNKAKKATWVVRK